VKKLFDDCSEAKILEGIRKNIKWVLKNRYQDSQTTMAKDLDIKINTLNTYINTSTKPPITFIWKLCSKTNLSIDQFVQEDLELCEEKLKKKEILKQIYNKYKGEYYTYFFVVDSNSLKEGLIQEGFLKISEYGTASFEILNSNKQFSGNLLAGDELLYFDLKNAKEKINLIVKNPGKNIKEKYLCGTGIINISSPEDSRIPSAQKIIVSRVRVPIDKYFKTLSDFLSINIHLRVRKRFLIDLLKNNIGISDNKYNRVKELVEDSKISDEDKIIIGERQVDLLQEVLDKEEFLMLKRSILESASVRDVTLANNIKANLEEDKMVYRFIKNEFNNG